MVVIQQWEGPRPLGRVERLGRLGEGQLPSAPREKDMISRAAGGAARAPKNRMSCRGSALRGSAGLQGGGGAWEDVGLLLLPDFGLARSCLEQWDPTQA